MNIKASTLLCLRSVVYLCVAVWDECLESIYLSIPIYICLYLCLSIHLSTYLYGAYPWSREPTTLKLAKLH